MAFVTGEMQTPGVVINDTTLRDGEQSPGVGFSTGEKVHIALMLESAGVPELEIGIPAMGEKERATIREITGSLRQASTMAWCRMTHEDIRSACGLGLDWVDLSVPVSVQQLKNKLNIPVKKLLSLCLENIRRAVDAGLSVCVGMEDASRAEDELLHRVVDIAGEAGARRVRFADTLGVLDPVSTYHKISDLRQRTDLQIEMHAHNDLGLATANTLAAVDAGAYSVNTTVTGLGERAGNAALEEVAVALNVLNKPQSDIDLARLPALCRYLHIVSGRTLSPQKAIVGDYAFTHESGVHIDGLLKDINNYQSFPPSLIGRKHHLVLGKHSGIHAIDAVYRQLGISLTRAQCEEIREALRDWSETCKCVPGNDDLMSLIDLTMTGGIHDYQYAG
ncbi:2-isopropylmalate synthase [Vibrio aerogenes CECT 7868]|uniref:Homocitrate synthase n=1 Tax=Vibrio aerogenes CECT 7868 TaxID=1216006 RepID=A0A1M5WZ57_9VIBR|nr:homocitrate synthase [Vibrio aerogenes]SHH92578.1 2-isopropylmalate synthase [Vibrio aerogenes CECT 7868]